MRRDKLAWELVGGSPSSYFALPKIICTHSSGGNLVNPGKFSGVKTSTREMISVVDRMALLAGE